MMLMHRSSRDDFKAFSNRNYADLILSAMTIAEILWDRQLPQP